ncbi:ABC transporter permease subunit, partial [Bradyrhizobium uaiense]|uniref:ABC transporter permease subunit n=1 Tax=Bradyrhizobium uaiense TaxID=2594946 RepID=UPI001F239AB5
PGSGLLLNSAIFQRDLPLLQGTILVLALFFVLLNLLVDIAQAFCAQRLDEILAQDVTGQCADRAGDDAHRDHRGGDRRQH